jgi:hypothetical protein
MTKTEANRSRAAKPRELARAAVSFHFPAGATTARRAHLNIHGVLTMQLFVDLKICEICGSLWYRPSGGATVYCIGCSLILGKFPSPRLRTQPGGRKKKRPGGGVFLLSQAGAN